jgi:hypothetical protein
VERSPGRQAGKHAVPLTAFDDAEGVCVVEDAMDVDGEECGDLFALLPALLE